MDNEKLNANRAKVERNGKVLLGIREERGIESDKGPCAFDKVQLNDWASALDIEDERERVAYLASVLDYWFTGVYPDHLTGEAKTYFKANYNRFKNARRQSFAKSGTLDAIDLEAWADGRNGMIPADDAEVPNEVPNPVPNHVPNGVQPLHSYKPQATNHGLLATGDRPTGLSPSGERAKNHELGRSVFETGVSLFHAPCPTCGMVANEPRAFIDGTGHILVRCPECGPQTIRNLPDGYEVNRGNFGDKPTLKSKESVGR